MHMHSFFQIYEVACASGSVLKILITVELDPIFLLQQSAVNGCAGQPWTSICILTPVPVSSPVRQCEEQ